MLCIANWSALPLFKLLESVKVFPTGCPQPPDYRGSDYPRWQFIFLVVVELKGVVVLFQ